MPSQLLQPKVVPDITKKKSEERKHKQARYYDRGAKDLQLKEGDVVQVRSLPGQ